MAVLFVSELYLEHLFHRFLKPPKFALHLLSTFVARFVLEVVVVAVLVVADYLAVVLDFVVAVVGLADFVAGLVVDYLDFVGLVVAVPAGLDCPVAGPAAVAVGFGCRLPISRRWPRPPHRSQAW